MSNITIYEDMEGQLAGVEDYYPLLDELGLQSAVSGKITARLELAEPGEFKAESTAMVGRETVSKKTDSRSGYNIVADTKGTLLWKSDDQYEKPHIFDIERLRVVGGPAINTAFLDAGLLDEVIVLIGAGIDGRASYPPVFNRNDNGKKEPTPLKLVDVKKYSSGAVFIRYKTK